MKTQWQVTITIMRQKSIAAAQQAVREQRPIGHTPPAQSRRRRSESADLHQIAPTAGGHADAGSARARRPATGLGIGAHAPEDLVDEYSPDVATIVSTQSAMQICFSRVFERAGKAAVDRGDFDLTGWVTAEQTLAGRDPEFDPEFSTATWDRINAAMSEYADLLASGMRPN